MKNPNPAASGRYVEDPATGKAVPRTEWEKARKVPAPELASVEAAPEPTPEPVQASAEPEAAADLDKRRNRK